MVKRLRMASRFIDAFGFTRKAVLMTTDSMDRFGPTPQTDEEAGLMSDAEEREIESTEKYLRDVYGAVGHEMADAFDESFGEDGSPEWVSEMKAFFTVETKED